jgi:prepilin-type processing-associated H-X9-DG protein
MNPYLQLPLEITEEGSAKVFRCPSDKGGQFYAEKAHIYFGNSYQTNFLLIGPGELETDPGITPEPWREIHEEVNKFTVDIKRAHISEPARVVLLGDNNWVEQWFYEDPYDEYTWHDKKYHYNMAFVDGRVEFIHIRKGLYVAEEYKIVPVRELYNRVRELQEEVEPGE